VLETVSPEDAAWDLFVVQFVNMDVIFENNEAHSELLVIV
jgi:hypothetical protein